MDMSAAVRIVDAVPYPVMLVFLNYPAAVEIAANGEVALVVSHPSPRRHLTRMDVSGHPVAPAVPPMATTAPRVSTPLTRQQALAPAPRLRGPGSAPFSSTDLADFDALVASGAPVGEFIARRLGSPHIQALMNARRWRRMLREDEYMTLVGTAEGHVFALAIPVNEASIRLTGADGVAVPIGELPPGTRIIDDLYGVSTTVADYPGRVRSIASQWEREGQRIETPAGALPAVFSPSAFTERVLSSPVRFGLWSPANDPIKETQYLGYIHDRHANPRETQQAGLDWLDSPNARSEYARYFPADIAEPLSVSSVSELVRSALDIEAPAVDASDASSALGPR